MSFGEKILGSTLDKIPLLIFAKVEAYLARFPEVAARRQSESVKLLKENREWLSRLDAVATTTQQRSFMEKEFRYIDRRLNQLAEADFQRGLPETSPKILTYLHCSLAKPVLLQKLNAITALFFRHRRGFF